MSIPQNILQGWATAKTDAIDNINDVYADGKQENPEHNQFIDFLFKKETQAETRIKRWCDPEYRLYLSCPLTAEMLVANFRHYYVDDGIFHFYICDVVEEFNGLLEPFFVAHFDGTSEEFEEYIINHFPHLSHKSDEGKHALEMKESKLELISRRSPELKGRYLQTIENMKKVPYRQVTLKVWLDYWPVFIKKNKEIMDHRNKVMEKIRATGYSPA